MALPTRITLVKEFDYRGLPEEWSNTYGLTGGPLADYDAMKTLCGSLAAWEKTIYLASSRIVRALVYQPGAEVAARVIDFSTEMGGDVVGSLAVGSTAIEWAGDQAGWIRGKIGVNVKGRPVYVRKYYHGGASGTDSDLTINAWRTAAAQLAAGLTGGQLTSGRRWCGPDGEDVTLVAVSDYVTTRTLKRRGKRPTSP